MDGDIFSGIGNGTQVDSKVLQTFHKSFVQASSGSLTTTFDGSLISTQTSQAPLPNPWKLH
ncbi:unnamed protein product, partial [Vitis vinifera]